MNNIATDEQKAICERFGSNVFPAASDLKVGIALSTLNRLPLTAIRHQVESGTCGWYIWGGDYSPEPDFYQSMHFAHIQNYCPTIVPYLALAPGWGVMLAPEFEEVWFDKSFLDH